MSDNFPIYVDSVEEALLSTPQVDCPVVHHFGPGIYIREVNLPAGALCVGHAQKHEHMNLMLKGAVAMLTDDGNVSVLRAPLMFVGKPGRKIGLILEDVVWQNIYATEERDVDTLERTLLDKSPAWEDHSRAALKLAAAMHQEDRDDYVALLAEVGVAPEVARAQSENEADQTAMPDGYGVKLTVRNSPIEGRGVFLSSPAASGEILAIARIDGKRTVAGRYTNHSKTPNAIFKASGDTIYLVAARPIAGCCGGDTGEEVTVDYRQAIALAKEIAICQQ